MFKLAAAGLVLAGYGSSAHAMPLAPLRSKRRLVVPVRAGMWCVLLRVNGVCVRTPARAAVRRGAVRR